MGGSNLNGHKAICFGMGYLFPTVLVRNILTAGGRGGVGLYLAYLAGCGALMEADRQAGCCADRPEPVRVR